MEEALKKSWVPLPERSLENQLLMLLVHVNPAGPNLIVIDGLDECASQDGIIRLIDWLRKNRPPFRFLFTSRPEPDIEACCEYHLDGRLIEVRSLSLTESKNDIRKYFVEQLEKIRQHRLPLCSPSDWPSKPDIDKLVSKSEGLFVHAATAVRYIGGEGHADKRLKNVLRLHKGLDSLYDQVIREAKRWDDFDIVMASLMYLQYPLSIDELSMVLLNVDDYLNSPVICSALSGCHSILMIPANFDTEIKFYHASLQDFLTDQSRSLTLFYAPTMSHAQLMVGCFRAITRAFNSGTLAPRYALTSWCYHAGLFLSMPCSSKELGGLRDEEAEELVEKIDMKWVKSWMAETLGWAGVSYLIQQLHHGEVREKYDWRDSSLMIHEQGSSRHRLDSTPEEENEMHF
ncbi:hypothetical protein AX14_010187 [Amanita brunnescens Koide BX004]|nr:hypothetical protein AX14_010187 [Amanita brunnescens Koide BX004]